MEARVGSQTERIFIHLAYSSPLPDIMNAVLLQARVLDIFSP